MVSMQLGAVTYNVLKDMDLETVITTLEGAGFEAVELRTTHKHGVEPSLTPAERVKVRERFGRSKVRLLSYGTACEFHAVDPAARKRGRGEEFIDWRTIRARGAKVRAERLRGSPATTIRTSAIVCASWADGAGDGVEIWLEVHGRDTAAAGRRRHHEGHRAQQRRALLNRTRRTW
jgi:hypothetical protein